MPAHERAHLRSPSDRRRSRPSGPLGSDGRLKNRAIPDPSRRSSGARRPSGLRSRTLTGRILPFFRSEVPGLQHSAVSNFLQHPGNPVRPRAVSLVVADEEVFHRCKNYNRSYKSARPFRNQFVANLVVHINYLTGTHYILKRYVI
jgi:hypothetical protein